MLTLITSAGAVPLKVDDYYIRELASGLDELLNLCHNCSNKGLVFG